MYPPLDLRQVACFAAAARAGTMTAAGDELMLSQSAVSLAVRGLERRIGAQLLVRRSARTLLLTPAGARFLPAAVELLAHAGEVERLSAAAGDRETVAGPLTVGCFPTFAPFLLPGLIESFTAVHPQVELDFVEAPVPELESAMRAGACDLAIVDVLDLGADMAHETLFTARPHVLLAADDPLAARAEIDVEELAVRDMILFDLPPSGRLLERVFADRGVTPRIRHRSTSHELVRALVGRGLGFALLVTRPAHDLTHEGLPLATVPLAGDVAEHDFALTRPAGARLTRQADAFAAHCHEHAPALGRAASAGADARSRGASG